MDLAIIGSGSGNSLVTPFWDDKRVAIAERHARRAARLRRCGWNEGRRPNSDLVGAAEAGIDLHDDGRIKVDEYQRVIADRRDGKILGAHVFGYLASNLIQVVISAMSFGIDAHTAAMGQYWIHTALMEVAENALLGLDVPKTQLA